MKRNSCFRQVYYFWFNVSPFLNGQASSSGKGLHLPSTQQSQVAQSSSSGARPNYYQATPQLRMQILRSKVTEAMQTKDETTVAKITEDLSKLSVEQQAYLLSNPKIFTTKVQETEQVLKRLVNCVHVVWVVIKSRGVLD